MIGFFCFVVKYRKFLPAGPRSSFYLFCYISCPRSGDCGRPSRAFFFCTTACGFCAVAAATPKKKRRNERIQKRKKGIGVADTAAAESCQRGGRTGRRCAPGSGTCKNGRNKTKVGLTSWGKNTSATTSRSWQCPRACTCAHLTARPSEPRSSAWQKVKGLQKKKKEVFV